MIKFSGPDFQRVDNRVMSLELVQQGLANAAMFTSDGEVVQQRHQGGYQKLVRVAAPRH